MTGVALGSVNCTSCGAGLSVLGGGRVLSHVCGYCGAVLDTQDNYKVVDSIGKRNHPASPVQIGQTLTLEGVVFTVIGTLGIVERYGGRTWTWVEHQIYSPTHGYLWLNVEEGQLTWTRKLRDFNMGHWLSVAAVERAEVPPTRTYRGEKYRYYDTSVTRIDFMEGEFNWVPKLGEKKTVISLLGPEAMLSLVTSQSEREVELTRHLPRAQTAADLGFDESALGRVGEVHPLTGYAPLREEVLIRSSFLLVAVAALVLGMVFMQSSGRTVLDTPNVTLNQLPRSYSFEVSNLEQLTQVEVRALINNAWATFAVEVAGPDGQPAVAAERTISYYSGRSGGENWSEGSRFARFTFRPDVAGSYTLSLARAEGGDAPGIAEVDVRVHEGKPTGFWLFLLSALSGLGWLLVSARSALHSKRRFAGSDWSD